MSALSEKITGKAKTKADEELDSATQVAKKIRRQRMWYLLLVFPYVCLLWPSLYARNDPTLFSFPFFYWYQFLWVPLSAVLTGIVYVATRRR